MSTHRRSLRLRPSSYEEVAPIQGSADDRDVSAALRAVLQNLSDDENFVRRVGCKLFDLVSLRVTGVMPELPYFYRVLPMWDGTRSSSGRNYKAAWKTLLDLCSKYSVSPLEYLIHALSEWKLASTPEPNRLITDNKIKAFSRMVSNKSEIERELRLQQETACRVFYNNKRMYTAMGIVTPEKYAHNAIIGSTTPPFTPLFCYIYALGVGEFGAASKLQPQAVLQYLTHRRVYDEVWGALIPEHLRQATCNILSNLTESVEYVPTSFPTVGAASASN